VTGIYEAFFDGGCETNPGRARAGFCIHAPDGSILCENSVDIDKGTNNEAEYQGLIFLLQELVARDIKKVLIFGDSKLVVCQVNNEWRVNADNLRPLYFEARKYVKMLDTYKLVWVPRKENPADSFASMRKT